MNEKEFKKNYQAEFLDPVSKLKDHELFQMFVAYYSEQERIDSRFPGFKKGGEHIPFPCREISEARACALNKYPSKALAYAKFKIGENEYYQMRETAMRYVKEIYPQ